MSNGYGRYYMLGILIALARAHSVGAADRAPLTMAHAHNDYHHPHPLTDALSQGFCSVEADVYVIDGELLVGHDREELRPTRTLRHLYLDPLLKRTQQHDGRVFAGGPTFTLLIDFKSAAEPTYTILREQLLAYQSMLVGIVEGRPQHGAVQIVISGNRPLETVAAEYQSGTCWVGIDGRLPDLRNSAPRPWMPLISDRWTDQFQWNGIGVIPADERLRLREIVTQTHAEGRRLRFWATPDHPAMWQALRQANVDLINTDDLAGLASFLTAGAVDPDR